MYERLEFNYELFTSSDTLAEENSNGLYIYILVTVAILMAKYIWEEENS